MNTLERITLRHGSVLARNAFCSPESSFIIYRTSDVRVRSACVRHWHAGLENWRVSEIIEELSSGSLLLWKHSPDPLTIPKTGDFYAAMTRSGIPFMESAVWITATLPDRFRPDNEDWKPLEWLQTKLTHPQTGLWVLQDYTGKILSE